MSDARYAEAARMLRETEEVALACHVNPDADAIGSMLGLAHHLRGMGKRVVASWGNDPFSKPRFMQALPSDGLVAPPQRFPEAPRVLVTLDAAAPDRLGVLLPTLERAGAVICVDHHATNEGFGTVNLVEPRAASTAEVVHRLIATLGGKLSTDAAACLYAGIVTDTGRFQYEAASAETLRVAAELREAGFDHTALAQALFEDNSVAFLRALALALARVEFVPDPPIVWTYVTQKDLAEARLPAGELDDLIDVIRTAREADVAAVIRQQRDGTFKVSLRSRGGHDVGSAGATFGGGGHALAAGYTSRDGLEETVRSLVAAIRAHPIDAHPDGTH